MKTHELVLSAFFIALGIILPIVFHFFGGAGNVFLPMHIPVLLAGFFLGRKEGALIGVLTPILSSVFTGMPPVLPMLPIMVFELGTYGYAAGYFRKIKGMGVIVSLIIAMVLGRMAASIAVLILVEIMHIPNFNISPIHYFGAMTMTGLPGILVQLVFLPPLLKRLHEGYSKYKNK